MKIITFGLFGISKLSSGSFVLFLRLLGAGSSISTRCKSSIPKIEKKKLKKKQSKVRQDLKYPTSKTKKRNQNNLNTKTLIKYNGRDSNQF